jgi:hypothetical protein
MAVCYTFLFSIFYRAKTSSSAFQLESSVVSCLAKKWYIMSGLRVSLAQSTYEAINALQISTRALLMSCPLSGHLDKGSHYLAYLSTEELGLSEINSAEGTELPLEILKVNIMVKYFKSNYLHFYSIFHSLYKQCNYKYLHWWFPNYFSVDRLKFSEGLSGAFHSLCSYFLQL